MNIENTILAGDVGGTKTLIALFQEMNGLPVEIRKHEYVSRNFSCLENTIHDFLKGTEGIPMAAAFGIPGPVSNGIVKSTNLPWVIDEKILIEKTGIPRIKLMNDLVATANSLPILASDEIINIKTGNPPENPERYVVLAPGTGLGQSFLIHHDGKTIVIPSEGGHADFAPTNEIEAELYQYLLKKYGHVSFERIISGSGLPNIFDFLVEIRKEIPEKETIEKMKTNDRAAVISEMALSRKDEVCKDALDIFISILGTHAGNLALTFLADGGVYLAGGIPFKILPKLRDGIFTKSFLNKGRMKSVLYPIPVNVITNNQAALKGAAKVAFEINKQQ
jgi:glucokinase